MPLIVVEIPSGIVCQYQVTPLGGVPVRLSVTPFAIHCGLLLAGFAGFAGCALTVIDIELLVPFGFEITTLPEVVLVATTAVIDVELTHVTLVHGVPFMETVVTPDAKFKPVIVMVLPTQTGFGVIPVTRINLNVT